MNDIVISRQELANKIETMISKQTFFDWYNKDYEEFIEGMEDAKSKKKILEDILSMLNI